MAVQNYIRVAAYFRAPGVCCAVGVLCERLSWQLEFSLCPFYSLSCSPVTAAVTLLLPCFYLDSSAPVNMSYDKETFLVVNDGAVGMADVSWWVGCYHHVAIDILCEPAFRVLCVFFNSLAIVLDLIFCLRKIVCMVRCPWGHVCACSNIWVEVSIFLKLCLSILHTINL